jgi:LAO/AO transport system kinase
VWEAVGKHRNHLESGGQLEERRAKRLTEELRQIVVHRLEEKVREAAGGDAFVRLRDAVVARELDPYTAAEELLAELES